ncbi:MAG: hypothetical protein RBR98_00785 [Candidatus Moranbacteria bacterium]|jgi:uncharacterized membrane protein YcjF (UPF0283 family)|nr:hypothetical protein [Candidatus Moranbacteria bacterium]NLC31033.1 hypothetical protein [Candidatus Moranbacteria bacterium]
METKNKTKKKKESGGAWKELGQIFTANILSRVGDTISTKVKNWTKDLKRRALGALLILIGLIFILVCVALYVNTFVSEEASWIGYGFVGILVLGAGYLLSKNN